MTPNILNEKMTFEKLSNLVEEWADEKGILQPDNWSKQAAKVSEELGETLGAILKGKRYEELDGFGDLLVTIIILAKQRDINLTQCLELAYNEIKGRKGKLVNGNFVKDEELKVGDKVRITSTIYGYGEIGAIVEETGIGTFKVDHNDENGLTEYLPKDLEKLAD